MSKISVSEVKLNTLVLQIHSLKINPKCILFQEFVDIFTGNALLKFHEMHN